MGSNRRVNPYPDSEPAQRGAWIRGYDAAEFNRTADYAKRDCATEIQAHQHGVKAGRALAADEFGERLILMAQEYGAAQFVFTREDLEVLSDHVDSLASRLSGIELLR